MDYLREGKAEIVATITMLFIILFLSIIMIIGTGAAIGYFVNYFNPTVCPPCLECIG
jgi:hypothetical protein